MTCEECHMMKCSPTYPYFVPKKKTNYYCSICGDGIYDGEEYIKNDVGDYAHWECIDRKKDLAEWLGYEIEIMEED